MFWVNYFASKVHFSVSLLHFLDILNLLKFVKFFLFSHKFFLFNMQVKIRDATFTAFSFSKEILEQV